MAMNSNSLDRHIYTSNMKTTRKHLILEAKTGDYFLDHQSLHQQVEGNIIILLNKKKMIFFGDF